MPETSFSPVRLSAQFDPALSRWLWLVKWLLLIPHYIVLVFLWIAAFVLTVISFFAIVFTGRYPRSMFDFNVGVLRWTWRVAFYGYGALGTDRYPPFALADRPDYPARLEIDHPDRLSRGLVWVKWWLLALPQYMVTRLLNGVIFLLVLFAGIAMLFAGRYPRGIFDFVLGMQRWAWRVTGYAVLMTDRYPPFRLDQGGDEPAVQAESEVVA